MSLKKMTSFLRNNHDQFLNINNISKLSAIDLLQLIIYYTTFSIRDVTNRARQWRY
jgi:hypothetical protein